MAKIEKNIAHQIQLQFPALYRDEGHELVKFVEEYYKFLETQTNMSVYNNRRLFEYRDIATTLGEMIIFFQKKFLADLPLDDVGTVKFIVRNIMSLYRRKGSESGIILFFRMFFQEDVEIYYPASNILKPSDSSWKTGTYLQLFPNNAEFPSPANSSIIYEYDSLAGKNIIGSISGARAAVDKINFIMLNRTLVPIIYINDVKGTFIKFDDIITRVDGADVKFGQVQGSASSIAINENAPRTTDNNIGDIFDFTSSLGKGGRCIVTELQDEFTGTITYTIKDGGFGYTTAETRLHVSDQVVILDNADQDFIIEERLRDASGNEGFVTGQNAAAVGVKMNPGDEFDGTAISTLDRSPNITIQPADFSVSELNSSSPGDLFPDTGDPDDVTVTLTNVENIALITDIIGNFLNVPINSTNYSAVPPALVAMSGADPTPALDSVINEAFDLEPFDIGKIRTLVNVNPGASYENDVFAILRDPVMERFERHDQNLVLQEFSANFDKGDIVTQGSVTGEIIGFDSTNKVLQVRPYAYYGFTAGTLVHESNSYSVITAERNYDSKKFGENALVDTLTEFSVGRINKVKVINSGFGYIDQETVYLRDANTDIVAQGTLSALEQGVTEGYHGNFNSHIKPENKIRDNDYYQEFSYEIQGVVDPVEYGDILKRTVHPAGTKTFNKFVYKAKVNTNIKSKFALTRKDDYVVGGPPVVGPGQSANTYAVTADKTDITVDNTILKVDTL